MVEYLNSYDAAWGDLGSFNKIGIMTEENETSLIELSRCNVSERFSDWLEQMKSHKQYIGVIDGDLKIEISGKTIEEMRPIVDEIIFVFRKHDV